MRKKEREKMGITDNNYPDSGESLKKYASREKRGQEKKGLLYISSLE